MDRRIYLSCGALALLFAGCGGDEPKGTTPSPEKPAASRAEPSPAAPRVDIDMAEVRRLFANDPNGPAAAFDPSPAIVALGRALYHEKSLSKNGNLSCSSCHDLANYGVDGKRVSEGSTGEKGARNAPTSLNAFLHVAQFWDGRAASVEEQAIMPVLNPIEHGLKDEADLVALLRKNETLTAMFEKAFGPGSVTAENFEKAIGAFERTLRTRSRWDEFVEGKVGALTAEEKYGLSLFMKTGCPECHDTRLLGGGSFQVLGKARRFPVADQGRFEVTKRESDRQVFKVPSLVNVEKTAPYFHDGSMATLEDAVRTMADVQLGKSLKKAERAAIVAFLKATTGEVPAGAAAK